MKSMIVRNPILLFFLLGQLSTSLSEFFSCNSWQVIVIRCFSYSNTIGFV